MPNNYPPLSKNWRPRRKVHVIMQLSQFSSRKNTRKKRSSHRLQ